MQLAVSGVVDDTATDEHNVPAASLNVTEPVGVPAPGAGTETVAVYVTGTPTTGSAVVDEREVEVVTSGDVLGWRVVTMIVRYSAGSVAPTVYWADALVPSVEPAVPTGAGRRYPANTMVKLPSGLGTTLGP